MDIDLQKLDWSLIQSFLAVAETGSLSAAAAALRQSQPTLGRHIKTLEDQLRVALFQRHPKGLGLTEMGERIRPSAEAMRAAMTQIANTAEAEAGQLSGTVRIACSVFAAQYILPPIIAQIREAEPAISLVLQPSDDSDNLTFREADIAVRMYRPKQLDLVTRHIGDIEMGVFAAHTYLARKGHPDRLQALFEHDVVGYDTSPLMIHAVKALGYDVAIEVFAVRTDNQTVYWELVRAGCGIGFSQARLGRSDPLVQELSVGLTIPSLPVWLTTHETVRRIPRVDRVWSLLVATIPSAICPETERGAQN